MGENFVFLVFQFSLDGSAAKRLFAVAVVAVVVVPAAVAVDDWKTFCFLASQEHFQHFHGKHVNNIISFV
jgi:hypothetical protein